MKMYNLALIAVLLLLSAACSNKAEENAPAQDGESHLGQPMGVTGNTGVQMPEREPLMGRLEQMKERFYQTADDKTAETVNLAIDEIRTHEIEMNALALDDKIPMFTLPDATGKMVNIADVLKKGPVVIMWYRGSWCPYCNLQLHEMQEYLPYMKDIGASLVAISPMMPDSSLTMKERLELDYIVLSDSGNVIANKFGLVYKMPENYKKMQSKKYNFKKYYGNDSGELPLTMTYVVDETGTVRYHFGDSDYRMRAEPHEVMDILRRIMEEGPAPGSPALQ